MRWRWTPPTATVENGELPSSPRELGAAQARIAKVSGEITLCYVERAREPSNSASQRARSLACSLSTDFID
jgi:hypothetical protein